MLYRIQFKKHKFLYIDQISYFKNEMGKLKGHKKKIEKNQQENLLLTDNSHDTLLTQESNSKKRKYIPYLHKVYWFFYRRPIYFLVFIPSFLNGLFNVGTTISLALFIDSIKKENGLQLIIKYSFYQFLIAIFNGFLYSLSRFLWNEINSLIKIKMHRMLFKSMMMKDVEFFDQHSFGELNTVLENDVKKAERLFSYLKSKQITLIGNIISSFIFCITIEWKLTIFAIILTFIQSHLTHVFSKYAKKQYKASHKAESNSTTIASEVISNIRTVFSFNCQKHELKRFKRECDIYFTHESISNFYFGSASQISSVISGGALCVFLNIGSFFVMKGKLTPGFLFTLSAEAFNLAHQISSLFNSFSKDERFLESADRMFEIIDEPNSVPFSRGKEIQSFSGRIEFRDVWFKYPTRDCWVLKNVSFTISPGEITAFVGHSGSGKSTILQLILRFYDVSSGQILLDGIDIKELDPRWIHRVISVVQQDPCLFSMTIRENVVYGLDKEIEGIDNLIGRCLEISKCKDFINELPSKIDTFVGEKGTLLSGGQKQRIAIARALIRDPIVLITDEATSALDAESESQVQTALDAAMVGRTCAIIAHRLGTITSASMIYVFDEGEIVEFGTREELLSKKGAFYTLVERQLNLDYS